jgi:predicted dienelactone hydrolase
MATASARASSSTFQVGLRETEIVDRVTGEILLIRIWYPTHSVEQYRKIGGVSVAAAFDAPLAPGSFGLIAISHGTGGSTLDHRHTAAALARDGWIVVAPRHTRDNVEDDSGAGSRAVWLARPQQVRQSIDAVLVDPEIGVAVEADRIGAIGFSAGGYTVLALVGAKPDLRNAARHCREHRAEDQACRRGTFRTKVRAVLGVMREAVFGRSEAWAELQDPRIAAAVVMAPVAVLFDSSSFENVKVPVRLYRAERDQRLSYPFHAERVRTALRLEPEYIVVEMAPHDAFLAPDGRPCETESGAGSCEPGGFVHTEFHERLNSEIVDFFNRVIDATSSSQQVGMGKARADEMRN